MNPSRASEAAVARPGRPGPPRGPWARRSVELDSATMARATARPILGIHEKRTALHPAFARRAGRACTGGERACRASGHALGAARPGGPRSPHREHTGDEPRASAPGGTGARGDPHGDDPRDTGRAVDGRGALRSRWRAAHWHRVSAARDGLSERSAARGLQTGAGGSRHGPRARHGVSPRPAAPGPDGPHPGPRSELSHETDRGRARVRVPVLHGADRSGLGGDGGGHASACAAG